MGEGGWQRLSFLFSGGVKAKRFGRVVKGTEMKVWVYNLMVGLGGELG